MAERIILKRIAGQVYTPTMNRIGAGNTECFFPNEPIDL